MKRNKQAISLIVLVITIIVMVILAGAIILTLNNSGIINKAQEAVDATNEATVKEVASLAWAEAYADGARTEDELKAGVNTALEKNKINTDNYIVSVTTSGVTVKNKANVWVKKGFTVVKGDKVLQIGDSIAYDETAGGTKTVATNVDWKVLGADEDGNLLIMSASDVKTGFRLGDEISDCETGVKQLNDECLPYGYGEGVVGTARSITVEDVNKVTGYDPTTYGIGTLSQYGNVVTYSYNGTTFPAYSSVVASGTLSIEHNAGFYYCNGDKVEYIKDITTGTSGETFATLTSNYYAYTVSGLTTISKTDNAKAYSMLFGNDDTYYWFASPSVSAFSSGGGYGMFVQDCGSVAALPILESPGNITSWPFGIRAVVTLSSDISLTGNSTNGWSY